MYVPGEDIVFQIDFLCNYTPLTNVLHIKCTGCMKMAAKSSNFNKKFRLLSALPIPVRFCGTWNWREIRELRKMVRVTNTYSCSCY